jgi:hypothetical protein
VARPLRSGPPRCDSSRARILGEEVDHDGASSAHPRAGGPQGREGERLLNDGSNLTGVLRELAIFEATWNRWQAQYGGMKAGAAERLNELGWRP